MRARLGRWQTWFVLGGTAIIVAAAFLAPLPYFVESPGRVVTLGGCVEVHSDDPAELRGDFLLTTVGLQRATAASLVWAALDSDARLRPEGRVVRGGVDDRQHFDSSRRVFAQTAERSAALGLRAAGMAADPERLVGDGAVVTGVVAESPAAEVFRGGEIIVAVDGIEVLTEAEVRGLIGDGGEPVELRFVRDGAEHVETLEPVELDVEGEPRPMLGLRLETHNRRVDLPVPVDITGGRIGGPSAGLMIALAVYDQSAPGIDLAAGRRVAGTGTLSTQGAVGRIGGVDLKAAAAHEAGADVFLVPEAQAEEATALLGDVEGFEVVPVSTLEGAAQWLLDTGDAEERHGPPAPRECPLSPAA